MLFRSASPALPSFGSLLGGPRKEHYRTSFYKKVYFFDIPKSCRKAALQTVEKGFAEFAAKAANLLKSFLAAACTWTKIHLRLQVCELCAMGAQGVRAADCKNLAESPEGDFRHAEDIRMDVLLLFLHMIMERYRPCAIKLLPAMPARITEGFFLSFPAL